MIYYLFSFLFVCVCGWLGPGGGVGVCVCRPSSFKRGKGDIYNVLVPFVLSGQLMKCEKNHEILG